MDKIYSLIRLPAVTVRGHVFICSLTHFTPSLSSQTWPCRLHATRHLLPAGHWWHQTLNGPSDPIPLIPLHPQINRSGLKCEDKAWKPATRGAFASLWLLIDIPPLLPRLVGYIYSWGGACLAPCPALLVMRNHGRGWKEQLSVVTRPQSHRPARRPAVPERSPAPIKLHQGPRIRKQWLNENVAPLL